MTHQEEHTGIERNRAVGAAPWQRTDERIGYENRYKKIKRRTRVATLFPNEASLLRLVSSILMELSEEWETGRTSLSMDSDTTR